MTTPTEGRPVADAAMPLPTFADGRPYTPTISPETFTNAHVVELEMQATAEFTRDASAEVIRKLYRYVEPRLEQFSELAECVPFIQEAAAAYAAADYNTALSRAYEGYRSLIAIRALVAGLPPL